jgi:polyhydroxybutyrate depolymerase
VVHLPASYDSKNKYPLVILLHSTGQNAQDMTRLSRFDVVADRNGIIAVYPNSYGLHWDVGVTVAQPNREMGHRGGYCRRGLGFPGPFPWSEPGGAGQRGGGQGRAGQSRSQANDLAFFDQMLNKLATVYSVDANRVFATGYSDGGFMAFRLGCSMSSRIAAIGPVAAAIPKQMSAWCGPSRAVPLLILNGTSDPVVHYDGGSRSCFHNTVCLKDC